jgi:hypothetical protein
VIGEPCTHAERSFCKGISRARFLNQSSTTVVE